MIKKWSREANFIIACGTRFECKRNITEMVYFSSSESNKHKVKVVCPERSKVSVPERLTESTCRYRVLRVEHWAVSDLLFCVLSASRSSKCHKSGRLRQRSISIKIIINTVNVNVTRTCLFSPKPPRLHSLTHWIQSPEPSVMILDV